MGTSVFSLALTESVAKSDATFSITTTKSSRAVDRIASKIFISPAPRTIATRQTSTLALRGLSRSLQARARACLQIVVA